jgi:hypothetical protein
VALGLLAVAQDGNLAIDAEHVRQLRHERLVAPFEIILDLVRLRYAPCTDVRPLERGSARDAPAAA